MSGRQDYLQVRKLINMVIDMVLSKEEQYDHLINIKEANVS